MEISIHAAHEAKQLTITLSNFDWTETGQKDFHAGEQVIQAVVREIGRQLTASLLRQKVTMEQTILHGGRQWSRRELSTGHYQTLYGEITVERPTYQPSTGGATICPLEMSCHLSFGEATPRLAEILGHKAGAQTPREIAVDLEKSHLLFLSESFIRKVAGQVGEIALEKSGSWNLECPPPEEEVALIASGFDGTTVPLQEEGYKEAMCGTIALYNKQGERLRTTYYGTMPEEGKETFRTEFAARVAQERSRYPEALHVVQADGALWNWETMAKEFSGAPQILDFWHAGEHLADAAAAIFGTTESAARKEWLEKWKKILLEEIEGVALLLRELLRWRNDERLSEEAAKSLSEELEYIRKNSERMHYAIYRLAGLPIGTGVTEAACKELIKARLCRSGMRWTREGGGRILQLRVIRLSGQWESFWGKVLRYAA